MFPNKPCFIRLARWCAYVFLGVLLLVASFVLKVVNKSCSYARAEQVQLNLCAQYHRHEIDGNMCSALCDKKQMFLEHCGNNRARAGRKDVLIMTCDGCDTDRAESKVVMKIQVIDIDWNNVAKDVLGESTSIERMINQTKHFVKKSIQKSFDEDYFISAEDFLSGALGRHFRNSLRSKSSAKASYVTLKTVLALAMQPEFITLLAFRKMPFFPKLYGNCGPAYFVEYIPPLTKIGYIMTYETKSSDLLNMQIQRFTWFDRARLALQFLDIIRRMDEIGKKPLQICDFKPHNFGVNGDNNVAFLDSDDLVFDMRSKGMQCTSDDSCSINYCTAYCDKRTMTCTSNRKNNNLAIACRHLFLGEYELLGLLRSPPETVRKELKDTLVRCTVEGRHNKSARTDTIDYNILDRLETILRKSISLS